MRVTYLGDEIALTFPSPQD